jgi:hypothetical protein
MKHEFMIRSDKLECDSVQGMIDENIGMKGSEVDKRAMWIEEKQGFSRKEVADGGTRDQPIRRNKETGGNLDMMKSMILRDESETELRLAADGNSNTLKKGLRVKLEEAGC